MQYLKAIVLIGLVCISVQSYAEILPMEMNAETNYDAEKPQYEIQSAIPMSSAPSAEPQISPQTPYEELSVKNDEQISVPATDFGLETN